MLLVRIGAEILQRLFLIAQQAIIGLRQVIQRDGIFVVVIYSLFVEGQRLVRVSLRGAGNKEQRFAL